MPPITITADPIVLTAAPLATPTADPVVGYIDFAGNQTQADGGVLTIANIEVRLS